MRENQKFCGNLRTFRAAFTFVFYLVFVCNASAFCQGIDDKPDINSVIKEISHGDIEDRLDAFDDLKTLVGPDEATPAIPALQVCLSDPNESIRLKAVELLPLATSFLLKRNQFLKRDNCPSRQYQSRVARLRSIIFRDGIVDMGNSCRELHRKNILTSIVVLA